MKLASYVAGGKPSFGVVSGDGVITMNDRLNRRYATLRDALAGGALEEMRKTAEGIKPDQKLAGLQFLPVIPNPGKILCVGINYKGPQFLEDLANGTFSACDPTCDCNFF